MGENLNLIEILKDCPKGTKLYSPLFGEMTLLFVDTSNKFQPIAVSNNGFTHYFAGDGRKDPNIANQECMLFPSKENRDWSKFKPKFDPSTLKPFDKILGRGDTESPWQYQRTWCCATFSHINNDMMYPIKTTGDSYKYAVPYNDDTKHLVGTTDEAPEFYRYWED